MNTDILIDGQRIPIHDVMVWGYGGGSVTNGKGKLVGTYAGVVDFCFSARELADGSHTATLQATTTSGTVRTVTWDFEVADGDITTISTPDQATQE